MAVTLVPECNANHLNAPKIIIVPPTMIAALSIAVCRLA